jgi:hypothetical protein
VTITISLAEFIFMKKGQWVAGVVGKGRFSLVDFLLKNLKKNLRSPFWGSKVAKAGVAFARKTSKTLTSQKPAKTFLDQEKSCWEGPV